MKAFDFIINPFAPQKYAIIAFKGNVIISYEYNDIYTIFSFKYEGVDYGIRFCYNETEEKLIGSVFETLTAKRHKLNISVIGY